jgi:hypothetical protein
MLEGPAVKKLLLCPHTCCMFSPNFLLTLLAVIGYQGLAVGVSDLSACL